MPLVFKKRIPRHNNELRLMAKFLNKSRPTNIPIPVYVHDLPDLEELIVEIGEQYDVSADLPSTLTYYGLYIPNFKTIYLAVGAVDYSLAQLMLAHEYGHALQDVGNKRFTEKPADTFAMHAMLQLQTGSKFL